MSNPEKSCETCKDKNDKRGCPWFGTGDDCDHFPDKIKPKEPKISEFNVSKRSLIELYQRTTEFQSPSADLTEWMKDFVNDFEKLTREHQDKKTREGIEKQFKEELNNGFVIALHKQNKVLKIVRGENKNEE